MTLVTLQALPCGCVVAVYRARPATVDVEFIEAKGPHCRFFGHRAGRMALLGVTDSAGYDGDDAEDPTVQLD